MGFGPSNTPGNAGFVGAVSVGFARTDQGIVPHFPHFKCKEVPHIVLNFASLSPGGHSQSGRMLNRRRDNGGIDSGSPWQSASGTILAIPSIENIRRRQI
jgi:hypothetical protein